MRLEEFGQRGVERQLRDLEQQQPERQRRRQPRNGDVQQLLAGTAGGRTARACSRVITSARMTTDSVSTMNCVKERSGAPNSMNSSATAKPWMPSETIAVSRSLRVDDRAEADHRDAG